MDPHPRRPGFKYPGHILLLALALVATLPPWTAAAAELPEKAKQAMDRGREAAGIREYGLAIQYFEEALKEAPASTAILFNLGVAHAKAGHELAAIPWFEAYLAQAPGAPNAGEVRKEVTRLEEHAAEKIDAIYEEAIKLSADIPKSYFRPRNEIIFNSIAGPCARGGNITKALEIAARFPFDNADTGKLWYDYVGQLIRVGAIEEARNHMGHITSNVSRDFRWCDIADHYLKKGRMEDAELAARQIHDGEDQADKLRTVRVEKLRQLVKRNLDRGILDKQPVMELARLKDDDYDVWLAVVAIMESGGLEPASEIIRICSADKKAYWARRAANLACARNFGKAERDVILDIARTTAADIAKNPEPQVFDAGYLVKLAMAQWTLDDRSGASQTARWANELSRRVDTMNSGGLKSTFMTALSLSRMFYSAGGESPRGYSRLATGLSSAMKKSPGGWKGVIEFVLQQKKYHKEIDWYGLVDLVDCCVMTAPFKELHKVARELEAAGLGTRDDVFHSAMASYAGRSRKETIEALAEIEDWKCLQNDPPMATRVLTNLIHRVSIQQAAQFAQIYWEKCRGDASWPCCGALLDKLNQIDDASWAQAMKDRACRKAFLRIEAAISKAAETKPAFKEQLYGETITGEKSIDAIVRFLERIERPALIPRMQSLLPAARQVDTKPEELNEKALSWKKNAEELSRLDSFVRMGDVMRPAASSKNPEHILERMADVASAQAFYLFTLRFGSR